MNSSLHSREDMTRVINKAYSLIERIDKLLEEPCSTEDLGVPCSKIFIGNLHPETYASHIEDIFKDYSPIRVRAQIHGKPCIAFVDFKDTETATRAIKDLNGKTVFGRNMRIMYCRPENGRITGMDCSSRSKNYSPERDTEQPSRKRVRRHDDLE
jgi:RNA recognition motif-containing protein